MEGRTGSWSWRPKKLRIRNTDHCQQRTELPNVQTLKSRKTSCYLACPSFRSAVLFCRYSTAVGTHEFFRINRFHQHGRLEKCLSKPDKLASMIKTKAKHLSRVVDPDPYGSALIWVVGSGSGSRRAKMTHKYWKKLRIFMFRSGVLDVLIWGLKASPVACASFMEA